VREDFERRLDAAPDDWALRLVYADYLEEQGEADGPRLLRWQALTKVVPFRLAADRAWTYKRWVLTPDGDFWGWSRKWPLWAKDVDFVWADVCRQTRAYARPYVRFWTRAAAEDVLRRALVRYDAKVAAARQTNTNLDNGGDR
jgi:uncharacterized protein (TIGR02996 family)